MKLLIAKKEKRLGSVNGAKDILAHPFFAEIDVEKLLKREIVPPWKPEIEEKAGDTDIGDFFDKQDDLRALKDTYIPRANRKEVGAQNT